MAPTPAPPVSGVLASAREYFGWDLTTADGRNAAYSRAQGRELGVNGDLFDFVEVLMQLVDALDKPHVIHVRETGWEIQHALACRDDMIGCPVNVACVDAGWDAPPAAPGRYLITVEDGAPVLGEEAS